MAHLKSLPAQCYIDQLRGVIDFYVQNGQCYARKWPEFPNGTVTDENRKWQAPFACFHELYDNIRAKTRQDLRYATSKGTWTGRDYLFRYFMGSVAMTPTWARSLSVPFPPTCPDPLNRLALFQTVSASYSLLTGINLLYNRFPAGPTSIWFTFTPPTIHPIYTTTRGLRHLKGYDFKAPSSAIFNVRAGEPQGGNDYLARFFSVGQIDRWGFFFLTPFTGTDPQNGWSVSPWYAIHTDSQGTGQELFTVVSDVAILTAARLSYITRTAIP